MRATSACALLLAACAAACASWDDYQVDARAQRSKQWRASFSGDLDLPYVTAVIEKNGVQLVVMPDPAATLVQVDVRVDAGARDAPAGLTGLAHLVEHLTFEVRAEGGETVQTRLRRATIANNAYTTADSTHYQNSALPEALDTVLQIEADRFRAGCAGIDAAAFARERDVVRNELRERKVSESGPLFELMKRVYGEGHPYLRTPGGTEAHVAAMTLEDVCAFTAEYYAPDRLVVVVAGKVDAETAIKAITATFGSLPARAVPEHTPIPAPAPLPGLTELKMDTEDLILMWGFSVPAREEPGGLELEYLVPTLDEYLSEHFREDGRVKVAAAFLSGGRRAPVLVVVTFLDKKADADAIETALEAALAKFGAEVRGMTSLRAFIELVFGLEELPARAVLAADHVQFAGRITVAEDLQRLRSGAWGAPLGNQEEVAGAAATGARPRHRVGSEFTRAITSLRRERAVRVLVRPRREAGSATRGAGPRLSEVFTEAPREPLVDPAEAKRHLEAPPRADLPAARRFVLENGLEVVLQAVPSRVPAVTTRLVFRAGTAHEPRGQGGLARLTGVVFQHGFFRDRQKYVLVRRLQLDGSESGVDKLLDVGFDSTTIVVRHTMWMTPAVLHDLAYRLNTKADPRYSEALIDLLDRTYATSDDAPAAMPFAVNAALYGPDHVYARHVGMTKRSLLAIRPGDVLAFLRRHYVAKNAVLIVTGPFQTPQLDALERAVRDEFGRWDQGKPTPPVPAAAAPRNAALFLGIDTGDDDEAPQIQVAIAYPGVAGIDADHPARLVLAEMMERRVAVARDRLGASYGLTARYFPAVGPGSYEIHGLVASERAGAALAAMREGLAGLLAAEDRDFDADFAVARRQVLAHLLGRSATASALAAAWDFIVLHRLPDDYFDEVAGFVAKLSPEQVRGLAARELDPSREIVIIAGPRKLVEKAFADAGLPAPKFMKNWPRPKK